jgi:hypothetical protein
MSLARMRARSVDEGSKGQNRAIEGALRPAPRRACEEAVEDSYRSKIGAPSVHWLVS